jgi:hypothetical protein
MVCFTTRENHGDKHHKFSVNGELIQRDPTPKRRQEPPREKGSGDFARIERTLLKLVSTLVEKKLIDATDLLYIFGANDGTTDRGSAEDGSAEDHDEAIA